MKLLLENWRLYLNEDTISKEDAICKALYTPAFRIPLEKLKTNIEEMKSTPFVYPVLGVRNGLRVNFQIKLRGPVLQEIKTGSFTPNVDTNSLPSSKYHDHMLIEVLGNRLNRGIVQKITLMTDEEEEELRNEGCEGELAVEHIHQNVKGVELLNVEC